MVNKTPRDLGHRNPTPISSPSSNQPSNIPQPDPIGNRPRASRRTSIVWKHFSIVNKKNIRGGVEDQAECKYCKKKHIVLVLAQVTLKDMPNNVPKNMKH